MRRLFMAAVLMAGNASLAQVSGGINQTSHGLYASDHGVGVLSGSSSELVLDENPEYHISPANDFLVAGVANNEEIGDTNNVCPTADSDTTACLGQAFAIRRGNWATAPNCAGALPCWQFAASDHIEDIPGAPASNWDWLGEEPFAVNIGMNLNAVTTGYAEVFANRSLTSSNVPGVLVFLDHRLGGRDIVVRVGGAVTQTELDGNNCMLGVDETTPFIVTVIMRAASGADSIELYVNGASCDTGVAQGFSPSVTSAFGIPSNAGALVASEHYFYIARSETSSGDVATMEAEALNDLAYYANALGIALP